MPDIARLDPATFAVLTIDVQPAVLARFPEVEGVVGRMRSAIDVARGADALVAFARVYLTPDEAGNVSPLNKMFGHFASMTPPADGPDSAIDDRLGVRDNEPVFRKIRMGSFSTTDLDTTLRSRGIDTVVLAGVATSGAVLSTAREAADLDYRVIVLSDCCADFDDEVHRVLTQKVLPMTAEVIESSVFADTVVR